MKVRGFTLLDMLIAVAIVGILAAITVPGYRFYVNKTELTEIQLQLLQLQSKQEEYRLNHSEYAKTSQLNLPAHNAYEFSVENVTSDSYRLVAKSKKSDHLCVQLSLDESLNREPDKCW